MLTLSQWDQIWQKGCNLSHESLGLQQSLSYLDLPNNLVPMNFPTKFLQGFSTNFHFCYSLCQTESTRFNYPIWERSKKGYYKNRNEIMMTLTYKQFEAISRKIVDIYIKITVHNKWGFLSPLSIERTCKYTHKKEK